MGESLKDQLIGLGLAKPAEKKARRPKKKARGKPGPTRAVHKGEMSLDDAYRLREQEEKRSAAEKKRKKQEEDRRRRQLNAEIQQLVEAHALNDPEASLKRNFLYKGRIRSVLVTGEQLKALNARELGLVFLRGSYFVMSPEHVEQARRLSPEHVPDLGADDQQDDEEEFPVPDDLTW